MLLLIPVCSFAQAYRVATYNLRYAASSDTGNLWESRRDIIANLIQFHEFEVLGTQEGLANQIDDLQQRLPGFAHYGRGRDDGKKAGEHAAIFYNKTRFKLLNAGDFWLSETPGKPGLGWDATCCNRICSWVYLLDNTSGKRFYFFNAHFDHEGVTARLESARLIVKKVREIAKGQPCIFVGDLNGGHQSDWYRILQTSDLLHDTYNMVSKPYVNNGSFNAFGRQPASGSNEIIDHIFVSSAFAAKKWGVLTDTYRGKYPSDHFPVLCLIEMK